MNVYFYVYLMGFVLGGIEFIYKFCQLVIYFCMICILMYFVRIIGLFCFFILFLVCDVFVDKNDD